MKKFLCFTTSFCAAVCAFCLGGSAAFAETGDAGEDIAAGRFYPKDFVITPSFDNLTDYAAGGGKYLFLENNEISEYGNERVVTYKNSRKTITDLYFEGEEFYYKTDDDCIYALENFNKADNPEIEDFVSTVKTDKITQGDFYYHYDGDVIYVLENHDDIRLEGLSNLKQYGNNVYAVRTADDNKQVLCTLNGAETDEVKVENFDLTENIAVGNAYDALTSSATHDLQFVSLKSGYMTEVDLDALKKNSSTFTVGDTVQVSAANEPTALLLYTETDGEEGISIIAVNGKSYLIHPDNAPFTTVYPPDDLDKNGTATAGYIYSAPFESAGMRIKTSSGEDTIVSGSVKILKEYKKVDRPELDGDFYYVEYKVDEETSIRGFVRHGLVSTYIFNEEPPTATPDPDATTEDLVKPVVLVLIVLLLIAIAAGYLIYIGTSDKRKKKNNDKNN